jgi:hypothetical protein
MLAFAHVASASSVRNIFNDYPNVHLRQESQLDRREACAAFVAAAIATAASASPAAAAGVIEPCPTSGNCVSTASFKVADKYAAPWDYSGSTSDAATAFDLLVKVPLLLLARTNQDIENLAYRIYCTKLYMPVARFC